MKQIFKTGLLLAFLVLTNSCKEYQTQSNVKVKGIVLDDIDKIPEWLKMNVEESLPKKGLNIWIPTGEFQTSSLIKVPRFPRKISKIEVNNNPALEDFIIKEIEKSSILELKAVRNEQVSAQIAIASNEYIEDLNVSFSNFKNKNGEVLDNKFIQSRFVKYLSVERARSEYVWSPKIEDIAGEGVSGTMSPNVIGDPLVEYSKVDVPGYRAQPIWFTFKIPKNQKSGIYEGILKLKSKRLINKEYKISISVNDSSIPDYRDYKFHLDLWINPSSIASYYGYKDWSDEHWTMLEVYLKDYASRGGKNITTTITHEPWHKPWINKTTISQSNFGYKSMVEWRKNKEDNWVFDFSIFDKYIKLATRLGINESINAYSLTPFHTGQKIHYFDEKTSTNKIKELSVNNEEYKKTWTIFLKEFKKHLIKKGWFNRTYLGFDEKPQEVLELLYEIIRDSSPEFLDRIIVAGHPETTKYAQNLSISYMFFPGQELEKKAVVPVIPTISKRNKENKTTTFYLCAEPSHPNTLTYSPAIESQMIPWLALKYKTDGYLRWAYNNWTSNPFKKPVFIHNQGDDYYVYPGENGPISSIRWELLKEGIEDYELFSLIKEKRGLSDDDLKLAINLATKNQDGRFKKVQDMHLYKNLLLGDNSLLLGNNTIKIQE